jgi:hypothetical protein
MKLLCNFAGGVREVKNMTTEKQVVVDPTTWSPTEERGLL